MFVDIAPIIEELRDTNSLLNAVLEELRALRAQMPSADSDDPIDKDPE